MSLEIPQETIAEIYAGLEQERMHDWTLVVGEVMEAEQAETPMDGSFVEELADKRRARAFGEDYDYPVERTGPTLKSSLRIVNDILTIRHLDATRADRKEEIKALGADVRRMNAEGLERQHRLWEKGILRIFDQQTNTSMWSVEWDNRIPAGQLPPEERVPAMVDRLVLAHREPRPRRR